MLVLPNSTKYKSGQALLIVLLVMAVSLTVVLSIASRSVTDVATTKLEEESLRAFSAAETAVESALNNPAIGVSSGEIGDQAVDPQSYARYDLEVTNPAVGREFVHPLQIYSGESLTFWFVDHDANSNIDCNLPTSNCYAGLNNSTINICWGNSGTPNNSNNTPAIELSVYYDLTKQALTGNFSNVKIAKTVYDRNNSRWGSNNFRHAVNCSSVSGVNLAFSTGDIAFRTPGILNIPGSCVSDRGCLIMAKVKMFYNDTAHSVGVTVSDGNLPPQGIQVEATGQAGDSTRKVNVYQTYAETPSVLDAAVFSLGGLTQ